MQDLVYLPEDSQVVSKSTDLEYPEQQQQPEIENANSEEIRSPYSIPLSALTSSASSSQEDESTGVSETLDSLIYEQGFSIAKGHPHETASDVTIVAAKAKPEYTGWISEFCEEYQCTSYIYSLDEKPEEGFMVPYARKGHEASAYLSYIIDYYDELRPYTIFIHGRPEQWHNDVGGPSTKNVLANLRYEAVSINGYVNLRCTNRPGCPSTIFQAFPVMVDFDYQYLIDQLPQIFNDLLGIDPSDVPSDIGHQCCAQFAVTKEKIQERPRSDYIRILEWIATTDMTDNYGIGWLIEKLWHVIFGMPAVHCVAENKCRCDLYGWCGPNPLTNNEVLTPIS
ncbi:hypothetical protein N7478_001033 [Penicillium angulare]|uniref:uncharacterized protein n=1 Tax=Penicillium angulare TaxID=116970 RepID=UPI002540D537|nr:uncharacterized protein N7478_001033 [Penicillium angulare]KAJ5291782.1 hypothetical protein N7478_001033 [Penicillium angulare]